MNKELVTRPLRSESVKFNEMYERNTPYGPDKVSRVREGAQIWALSLEVQAEFWAAIGRNRR
jgi:hypothetical protein